MRPNFFYCNAHPGNEVAASGVYVTIYSSVCFAFPPVVSVFPGLVNFLKCQFDVRNFSYILGQYQMVILRYACISLMIKKAQENGSTGIWDSAIQ
mmetsp:Transcript_5295/g.6437  ORF Transcript_5295/g.6437 Transcript_5295/m.6437 type:complete len:95 (-) Transcript_5295:8-292(-)